MKIIKLLLCLMIPIILEPMYGIANDTRRKDYQYILDMSDAYNWMIKKNYVKAGAIVNNYQSTNEKYADAFLIMGEILLNQKYYELALQYFDLAEKMKDYLILKERSIDLYWNQFHAINQSPFVTGIIQNQTQSLNPKSPSLERGQAILDKIITSSPYQKGTFYSFNLGKAYFIKAQLLYHSDPLRSHQNFLNAIKNKFLIKSAYLYIAFFYATQNQVVINDLFRVEKGVDFNPPNKKNAFKLYYRNYLDSAEGDDDKHLRDTMITSEEYDFMVYTVKRFYQN